MKRIRFVEEISLKLFFKNYSRLSLQQKVDFNYWIFKENCHILEMDSLC